MQQPPATTATQHEFYIALARALVAENLSFSTYALMLATASSEGGRATVAGLSLVVGSSYWAVRNQLRRTPWFNTDSTGPLVAVELNDEAKLKLARVAMRLAKS